MSKGLRLVDVLALDLDRPSFGTEVAIVGGTGVYRGVSGYVVSASRGDSGLSDDTFHLMLP